MSEICAQRQEEARVPMFWNKHVYSTAMLSIDCGQVIVLVELVEINILKRTHSTCFFLFIFFLFVFAVCYLSCTTVGLGNLRSSPMPH